MEGERPAVSGSGGASDASITPDAGLPALDDRQVSGLREVGREWAVRMPARGEWDRSLPVDPHLKYLVDRPARRSVFVSIRSEGAAEADEVESTSRAGAPDSTLGRTGYRLRRALIGVVPWSVDGNVLELGRTDGPVLQYRAATPQPAPSD